MMSRRVSCLLLAALLCLLPTALFAQQQGEASGLSDLPGRWTSDAWSLVRSPADWQTAQWQTAGLLTAGALGLYLLDDEIAERVQDNRSSFSDTLSDFGKNFGEPWLLVAGSGGLYLTGQLRGDSHLAETGLLMLESYLFTGAATLGLKHLGRRHRPNSGDNSHSWDGPGLSDRNGNGDPDGFSFPSGHAAGSFAVASVLVERYPDQVWLPWTAYGLAGLTAFSRVNDHEHWASDVFVGGALGFVIGKAVCRLQTGQEGEVRVVPLAGADVAGLQLQGSF